MAVGANDAVTGGHDALFRQQGVFNAHGAHVVEIQNVVLVGKFPALFGLLGALDVLVGHKVIQHNVHPGLVKDRIKARFLKFVDGDGGGDVVAQHNIQLGVDELSRLDGFLAAVGGQNLLRHGHSHGKSLRVVF